MVQLLKIFVIAFLLLISLAIAQEAKLEMKFIGYGKSRQEIYISFKNAGQTTISDITLYVDGRVYKTIEGQSLPGSTFEEVLFLEEGKHLIEARSPEGAYASLEVTALKGETKPTETPTEKSTERPASGLNILWIVLLLVLIVAVILWFTKRS
jgi:hypothetical protein